MKLPLHKGLVKIPLQIRMLEQFGIDIDECPCCKNKTLKLVKIFYPWKQAGEGEVIMGGWSLAGNNRNPARVGLQEKYII